MTVLYLPIKTRLQRLSRDWKEASRPHYCPEYSEDTERGQNYRYYR
ncbi:MAG: hypothetical protein ACKVOE_04910 [Rickettsiales bacterium]